VIKVTDLLGKEYVAREMVLVKVAAKTETRAEILNIADIFRGKVVDVSPKSYTIEVTGDVEKIKAFLALLKPMGIKEVARTGQVALVRG
jgi:acetolactate synthase-1/3 small subunit